MLIKNERTDYRHRNGGLLGLPKNATDRKVPVDDGEEVIEVAARIKAVEQLRGNRRRLDTIRKANAKKFAMR
jgi:hypothetical protein